jgi:formyltetrahydrofolate-dependent phosphoribosylglycinamide formyltransferase
MIKKRVAILISGRGSNMEKLIDASAQPDFPAQIIGVLSNKEDAGGLVFAKAKGIPTFVIPHKNYSTRTEHDAAMHEVLSGLNPNIIALAGYMRIMTPEFVSKWQGKMINIHPSLLPKYKGTHTHERALEAGDVEHGCTVHFVTAELDDGPIIAQAKIAVLGNDSPDTLSARVLVEEHNLYPRALQLICERSNQI